MKIDAKNLLCIVTYDKLVIKTNYKMCVSKLYVSLILTNKCLLYIIENVHSNRS